MNPDPVRLHSDSLVADLHCDTVLWMRNGRDITARNPAGHVDLPRLVEGGVNLQVFACFLDSQTAPDRRFGVVDRLIALLEVTVTRSADRIALCRTAREAENAIAGGRIAAVIGIENGMAIESRLDNLDHFHRRGVRLMTLTHGASHEWCISSSDKKPAFHGLTDFGRDVVRRMNDLGMIIDVSHISVEAVAEVLKVTRDPVVASHSCVHSLCPHRRNLTDDQIRALAAGGGMIGINFCRAFLSPEAAKVAGDLLSAHPDEVRALNRYIGEELDRDAVEDGWKKLEPFLSEWEKKLRQVKTSVADVVDHIGYIVRLVGDDHVGLGSDFDGIDVPPDGLEDCSCLPNITEELVRRGYPAKSITKILGGNFMRIFRQVCG